MVFEWNLDSVVVVATELIRVMKPLPLLFGIQNYPDYMLIPLGFIHDSVGTSIQYKID